MRETSVRRDLRLSMGDAAGYGLMAGAAEAYVPAFALALGMSPVRAGLVATLPLLAGGLIQLLAPRAIERVASLRRWVVGCVVVQALSFVPLIVAALVRQGETPLVFAAASLYWAAGMGASAGWNPWMTRIVPSRIRARFFGRRMGFAQAMMLVGLLGTGAALYLPGAAHVLEVYAGLFAVALVARLGSAVMLAKQGAGLDRRPQPRMRLRSIPPRLRGTPRASVLGYLIVALSATAISGAFFTPYLLGDRGLGYPAYTILTATVVVTKIVASPALGSAIQRLGVRRVLTSCALAIAPIPLLWTVSGAFVWLLFVQIYAGVVWAGFELGMLLTLFDADDDAERTTLQVGFSALQAFGTASASVVGGVILGALGSGHVAYLWLFVVSTLARLAAALLLFRGLPRALVRLPGVAVGRAWTLAIRPWGGTIVRPIVDGLERLGVTKRGPDD